MKEKSMIYGIGNDICDVRRIRASLERHGERFAARILSDTELATWRSRSARWPERGVRYLATRFSAKEAFSKAIADHLAHMIPDRFLAHMSKQKRKGKIYIDYLRNAKGATAVAAYSTRARPGAPVSVPLAWDELSVDMRSDHFTIANLPDRLSQLRQDPWKDYFSTQQRITRKMLAALASS